MGRVRIPTCSASMLHNELGLCLDFMSGIYEWLDKLRTPLIPEAKFGRIKHTADPEIEYLHAS